MFDTTRTTALIGSKIHALTSTHIVIVGCGGVGGTACEVLARAGIGDLTLIDNDTFEESNLNRQIFALHSTLGQYKVQAAVQRINDINPAINVKTYPIRLTEQSDFHHLIPKNTTYLLDCIDDIPAKGALISYCLRQKIPLISAMGAGKRLDSTKIIVKDFWQVQGCPLARRLRSSFRQQGIKDSFPCVTSLEVPCASQGSSVGSFGPVVFTFGVQMASYVLSRLLK